MGLGSEQHGCDVRVPCAPKAHERGPPPRSFAPQRLRVLSQCQHDVGHSDRLGTCGGVGTCPKTRKPRTSRGLRSGPWRDRTSDLGIKSCPFAGLSPVSTGVWVHCARLSLPQNCGVRDIVRDTFPARRFGVPKVDQGGHEGGDRALCQDRLRILRRTPYVRRRCSDPRPESAWLARVRTRIRLRHCAPRSLMNARVLRRADEVAAWRRPTEAPLGRTRLRPVHSHNEGALELPIGWRSSTIAVALRQKEQR